MAGRPGGRPSEQERRAAIDTDHPGRTAPPLGLTALLWGSAFPAISLALTGYSPGSIALLRLAVAVLAVTPAVLAGRVRVLRRSDVPRMALFGVTGMTDYQLLL
ncbi:hypothetical protein [Streptomyces sp. NPDC058701]|uniref:hypothetical protein n=1 Tax=Streptomyces sp. NPDC058701 TaxID=3346608 RepID=UPI0036578890